MSDAATQSEAGGVTLRPAGADDDEFLFALYADHRRDEVAAWGWAAAQQETFLRFQYRAQQQRYTAEGGASEHRIILRDGQPIGRIIVIRSPEALRLGDIALLAAHRNLGIGAALIRDLQAEAARAGLPVRLHVLHGNRAARLYERLGFVAVGDTGSHLRMAWLPPGPPTKKESA